MAPRNCLTAILPAYKSQAVSPRSVPISLPAFHSLALLLSEQVLGQRLGHFQHPEASSSSSASSHPQTLSSTASRTTVDLFLPGA